MKAFFDTNIIVYAFIENGSKAHLADRLLQKGGTISVQVLNEFVFTVRRKHRKSWQEILRSVEWLEMLCEPVHALTLASQRRALTLAERYDYTIYDANILASALFAGCDTLYSEDMQDGQQIEGVTIRNPFTVSA